MDSTTKVLTFGEIMMRLSPPDHLRLEQATTMDVRYGGAEANVCIRLRCPSEPHWRLCPAQPLGLWGGREPRRARG